MLSPLYRHLSEISSASLTRVAFLQVASGTPEQRKVNHSSAVRLPLGVTPSKYIISVRVESSFVLLLSWKHSDSIEDVEVNRMGCLLSDDSVGIAASYGLPFKEAFNYV